MLAMGAWLMGPAPVGVSVAVAQEGTDQGEWRRLPPPGLWNTGTMAIETATGRVRLIGFETDGFQLWTYDRSLGSDPWRSQRIEGAQPRLFDSQYHYDEVGNRFLGVTYEFVETDSGPPIAEFVLWSLSLGATPQFERLALEGPSPGGRSNPTIVIDSPGRRLFLIGGEIPFSQGYRGDLWALRLDPPRTWERAILSGPDLPGGLGGVAFFETDRQRINIVGGFDTLSQTAPPRRVRSVDLTGSRVWIEPASSDPTLGSDGSGPSYYIASLGLFVRLVRGSDHEPPDSTYLRLLDVAGSAGWFHRSFTETPRPFMGGLSCLGFDPTSGRMIYLGGDGTRGPAPVSSIQHADVWSFSAESPQPAWLREYSSVDLGRVEAVGPMSLDPERRLVYSPAFSTQGIFAYRLDRPTGWEFLPGTGPLPPRREGGVSVFDSRWSRLLYFGGGERDVEFGDLWQCDPTVMPVRWKRILPEGDVPLPRIHATAVLDPLRHRMLLFGGFAGQALNDVWQLDLADTNARWSRIAAGGAPPPARWGHSAVYDSRRDAMIVFGGASGSLQQPSPMQDTWALSFVDDDTWVPLVPAGNVPISRFGHSAVYDPVGDRMVVLWGRDASGGRFDTASLELGPPARWESFVPSGLAPSLRYRANAFYDAVNDRVVALAGRRAHPFDERQLSDAWSIEWNRADREPPPFPQDGEAFILLGVGPNPSSGDVHIAFDLVRPALVQARIYDVRGRLVRELGGISYPPGRHVLKWDGRSNGNARLRDGVYFARIEVEGRIFSGKLVLMD